MTRPDSHRAQVERALVGCLMARPDLLADVRDTGIAVADFRTPKWAAVFAAVVDLDHRGEAVDPVTVSAALGDGPQRPLSPELHQAAQSVAGQASSAHTATCARLIVEAARLRRVGAACAEIAAAAADPEASRDHDAFCDWVESTLLAATARHRPGDGPGLLAEAVDDALDELQARSDGRLPGVAVGLADLDRITGGFRPGQLVVVGARPGAGKSALAFGVALHAAQTVGPALVVSVEMSRTELGIRALAGGGVASDRLLSGRLNPADFSRLDARRDQLAGIPMLIDDTPGTTLTTIRARARRQAAGGGLSLVVVDYVQLVASEGRRERRELEVAEVSRGLKALARELHVPVVAVAQLNRAVEQRAEKRPVLADLRDSGQLEQDADLVLLLHRPPLYDLGADPGVAEVIVAKHRNGPTDTIPLVWLGHRMTFVDAARSGEDG